MRKKLPKIVDIKFKKPEKPKKTKQIKELKYTLDRGTDGKYIKDLNFYYNINSDRFVTTDDAVLLLAGLTSKSTLEKNRTNNKDDGGERGPQYLPISARVVKYRIRWLVNFREGIGWETLPTELKHHYTVTAINIPQAALKSINKN